MEIGLVDAISALRNELLEAMTGSETSPIRFRLDSVDLEVQVVIGKSAEVGGKVRYWVVSAEGKGSLASTRTHTLRLHLQAATAANEPVYTSDQIETTPP
ncbi:trypco2 family protein [Streptomyces anandii]|uniref:trypco2 family protein n=1 Tax=Streptomyces anandii TaxID=285454 RepID=UPI000B30D9D8|nr:hypothetical protein GCM10010510_31820 [Streptomyces anandii JCM 4720]